jgi:hypothetical protein
MVEPRFDTGFVVHPAAALDYTNPGASDMDYQ